MPPLELPKIDWAQLAPELILICGALVLLTVGTFVRDRRGGHAYAVFTVAVDVAAMVSTIGQ